MIGLETPTFLDESVAETESMRSSRPKPAKSVQTLGDLRPFGSQFVSELRSEATFKKFDVDSRDRGSERSLSLRSPHRSIRRSGRRAKTSSGEDGRSETALRFGVHHGG